MKAKTTTERVEFTPR